MLVQLSLHYLHISRWKKGHFLFSFRKKLFPKCFSLHFNRKENTVKIKWHLLTKIFVKESFPNSSPRPSPPTVVFRVEKRCYTYVFIVGVIIILIAWLSKFWKPSISEMFFGKHRTSLNITLIEHFSGVRFPPTFRRHVGGPFCFLPLGGAHFFYPYRFKNMHCKEEGILGSVVSLRWFGLYTLACW